MNIMSDSEYKELEDLIFYQSSYVEGQLEHGQFDYQDMYGPGGHVRDLEVKRQALLEKKAEEEMAAEADDYNPDAEVDALSKSIDENV